MISSHLFSIKCLCFTLDLSIPVYTNPNTFMIDRNLLSIITVGWWGEAICGYLILAAFPSWLSCSLLGTQAGHGPWRATSAQRGSVSHSGWPQHLTLHSHPSLGWLKWQLPRLSVLPQCLAQNIDFCWLCSHPQQLSKAHPDTASNSSCSHGEAEEHSGVGTSQGMLQVKQQQSIHCPLQSNFMSQQTLDKLWPKSVISHLWAC